MLVALAILSAGLLGLIIYLAFSPKSSRLLKLAAFIALGLIALAVGINVIILIIGPGEDAMAGLPIPIFADVPQAPPRHTNAVETIIFLAIFLVIMALIIALAIRDHRKKDMFAKQTVKSTPFSKSVDLEPLEPKPESIDIDTRTEKDDFDLGLDFQDDK